MEKKPCSQPPGRKPGWPDGPDDVINKYGTYEVQSSLRHGKRLSHDCPGNAEIPEETPGKAALGGKVKPIFLLKGGRERNPGLL